MSSGIDHTSLIIAERKSDWAAWAERFRVDTPDVVVILQRDGESIADFSIRARARVCSLADDGRTPSQAVLVGGGRKDGDALTARSLTLRVITQKMASNGGGSVVLDDAGADRFSMAALASTTSMLVHGTGVRVEHVAPAPLAA